MEKNKVYLIHESKVVSETLDGEAIIINLQNGNYYSLNSTGSILWDNIKRQYSVDDIINSFIKQYSATEEEIREAVTKIIHFLKDNNLIVETESDAAATMAQTPDSIKVPFIEPSIQCYEDMQEMLLADPVHDVDGAGWPALKET